MLSFFPIENQPDSFYKPYFSGKGIALCDKSYVVKKIWDLFHAEYALSNGCLIIKNNSEFWGEFFDFPLSGPEGDVEKALGAIEDYCLESYKKIRFGCLNRQEKEILCRRYVNFDCRSFRNAFDYIYKGEDFRSFTGKRFAGQRNHINKFLSLYPNAVFKKGENSDKERLEIFFKKWEKEELVHKDSDAKYEYKIGKKYIMNADFEDYKTGCVWINDEIVAFCFASEEFETLVVHFEKALHKYDGVNVFMIREFARIFPTEYVNREDDAGEEGLRISKMQYHPMSLADEYLFEVKTELDFLKTIPVLHSERLMLNAILKEDAEEYFRLCTDEERNRYWGYDYKKDLPGKIEKDAFYNVAKHDFKEKMCLNFAIRKDGRFIGETVLFEFNGKGECKLGVRILPEFDGNGYGKEAFERTMKFAFYRLGIVKLLSSCYKANVASVKLHESLMKRTGEDEEKYYYAREY